MPPARAVFLFPSSGYNAHISISPVERRYTLFESSNVKLYCRQEKARRTHLQAFIAYAVVCKHSMRPRKRCRRAPAASRRLFIRPSGRDCLRLSLSACRPVFCPARSAASGQRVRRCTPSKPGGGAPSQGGFVSASSVLVPLSAPFCPLLSTCSRVVSRKVVRSKVVRES